MKLTRPFRAVRYQDYLAADLFMGHHTMFCILHTEVKIFAAMIRYIFVVFCTIGCLTAWGQSKPNIVFILSDDMGYDLLRIF